jgi:hypothetical protein
VRVLFDVRPHPDLLPREKEQQAHVSGFADYRPANPATSGLTYELCQEYNLTLPTGRRMLATLIRKQPPTYEKASHPFSLIPTGFYYGVSHRQSRSRTCVRLEWTF